MYVCKWLCSSGKQYAGTSFCLPPMHTRIRRPTKVFFSSDGDDAADLLKSDGSLLEGTRQSRTNNFHCAMHWSGPSGGSRQGNTTPSEADWLARGDVVPFFVLFSATIG